MMQRFNMIWRRLTIQLTADRRKFGVLCALTALGLLFWARIIVINNLPRTVLAEDGVAMTSGAAGSENSATSENQADEVRVVVLDAMPERDPFSLSSSWFPEKQEPSILSPERPKSTPPTSEDPEQAISRLRLEAVMQGSPMAVISGRTYRPGDWIDEEEVSRIRFFLVEVRRRSVLLEHGGRQFELSLDGSGI